MSASEHKIGDMLDKFKIVKELGHGGMGAVYLAEDTVLDRKVAIKVINRNLLAGNAATEKRGEVERRFIREAKVSAQINHHNIASVYDAVLEGPQWYIAMEYIDGEPLEYKITAEDVISGKDAAGIAWHILQGLQYAWDKHKIIHRDIKPANVMIDHDGVVKLIDLGIAKPMLEDDDTHHLTMQNASIATPTYASPEQLACTETLSYKTDIYALAVLLYETLTHKKPFSGKTPTALFIAKSEQDYQPLDELRPDLPPAMVEAINDMLMPRPDDRPNFEQLQQIFSAIYSGTTPIGAPLSAPDELGTSTSKLPVFIGVAVCLVLVAVAGAFMFRPGRDTGKNQPEGSNHAPPSAPGAGEVADAGTKTTGPTVPANTVKKEDFTYGRNLQIDLVWIPELDGWVSRYETTNAQYRSLKRSHSVGVAGGINLDAPMLPAVMVKRTDARKYCNWLSHLEGVPEGYAFRLPTRSEWRLCCGKVGPITNDSLCEVGKAEKNSKGLFGVVGNVWELTEDGMVCGGSWISDNKELHPSLSDSALKLADDEAYDNIGFRMVLMPVR